MSATVQPPTMGRVASLQTGQSNSPNVIDDSSGVDSPPVSPSPDMILASPGLSTSTDGTTRGAGKTSLPYTASEAKKAKKQREALDKEAQKQELKKLKAEIESGNLSVQARYDELHAADQERRSGVGEKGAAAQLAVCIQGKERDRRTTATVEPYERQGLPEEGGSGKGARGPEACI